MTMKAKINSAAALKESRIIGNDDLPAIEQVAQRFAIGITPHAASTIKNASDPVGKQYIPQAAELILKPQELSDPIGDNHHSPVKGIVHRYADRVLYKIANICAVYCRYCFRRDMIGPGTGALKNQDRANALDYIRNNKNIWEVILTGGDPLILSERQLEETLDALCAIDHVQVIRIHTRIPIANPERVTDALCAVLEREKAVYIALHINHAQEITQDVRACVKKLQRAGCMLLSQSVLLAGVNDDPAVLEDLFRTLTAMKIKPYYIHHPDLAPGTGHFRLSIARGRKIMKNLFSRISGIAMPHYMLDIPGGHGKIPLMPSYAEELENGAYNVEDCAGNTHLYAPGD